MWHRLKNLVRLLRHDAPTTPPPASPGALWDAADRAAAVDRLHAQARQDQAEHRPDGPAQ